MSNRIHTTLKAGILLAMGVGITSVSQAAILKTTPTKTTTVKTTTKTNPTKTTKTTKTTTTKKATVETIAPVVAAPVAAAFVPSLPAPTVTATTYPAYNVVSWNGTDIQAQNLTNVPMPTMQLSDFDLIKTVVVPLNTQANGSLDVSVLDDFISYVSPMARHYPPVFPNKTERYNATQRVKQLTAWINQYAEQPDASYDVLLRAAKINAIGRNLDLGSDYAIHASNYIARALKLNDTAEANFLYGVMLAEGGGFVEGSKYLEKAESMGYAEATQSLAQADLLDDKKERAIQRLNEFKAKYPNDPLIDEQLRIVNNGQYYIWNIPANMNR